MDRIADWPKKNHPHLVADLARLVSLPSVSTDAHVNPEHKARIDDSAALTADLMRKAGLQTVEVLTSGTSNPYVYGEWLGAAGKPTVFLYSHHDVQPVHQKDIDEGKWHSDPWVLTPRDGRLYGRGSSDDKGGVVAQLGAIAATLQTEGKLPVNVKMLVEGEEEVGSPNLFTFFRQHRDRIQSDVIVVCDTDNIDSGVPSLTYSLRGNVALLVEVETSETPVHSGGAGGFLADSALALSCILSRLYWGNGPLPVPGLYDAVRPVTDKERKTIQALPGSDEKWRSDLKVLPGVRFANETGTHPFEQTWRKPAVTIIALEASSIKGASNQVLPKASAIVSCRVVPDQDPEQVVKQLTDFLTKDPPWNAKVTVKQHGGHVKAWLTDPNGPAFEAALSALHAGFGRPAVPIGSGGTIGFVGPLSDLLGGAPALLFGIGDPRSGAHAPDESLNEADWGKLMASLAHLFQNLGRLPPSGLK
jgi:acetylornithine deacetylase/succinyl-diaminopimelate desuccinylase-like protein